MKAVAWHGRRDVRVLLRHPLDRPVLQGGNDRLLQGILSEIEVAERPDQRRQGPAALLQGLRDNFGAHTYKRVDRQGSFHVEWAGDKKEHEA